MISFQNVTKDFKLDERTTITPVKNTSLEVKQGEFVMIVGRSGTGKTTLLNLAAGMVKPTSGTVAVEGSDLSQMTQKQLSILRSQKIGFIFQFPSLIPALTVEDNVCLPSMFASTAPEAEVKNRAVELLGTLGLKGKSRVHPRQLSAGETKRVVIARSLINQPQIVLADEPTSDLDEGTEKEVMDELRKINSQGVTFLIVTHSLGLIPFATSAFEMSGGCLTRIVGSTDV